MVGIIFIIIFVAIISAVIWRVSGRRERAAKRSAMQTEERARLEQLKRLFLDTTIDAGAANSCVGAESDWLRYKGAFKPWESVPEEWSLLVLQKRGSSLQAMADMLKDIRCFHFPKETYQEFLEEALNTGQINLANELAGKLGRDLNAEELARLHQVNQAKKTAGHLPAATEN